MRKLADLPHRFWPESELPADVKVWPKFLNLKAAEFGKVFNKQVNPKLRALGFKCKGMRGRVERDELVILSWFVGDKAGGSGYLAFAAHPFGLPARNHFAITRDEVDFPHCVFVYTLQLYEGRHGTRFDLGKDTAEAAETCELLLETIAEQAEPFLAGLPSALASLRSLALAEFDHRMPDLLTRHHIRVVDGLLTPFSEQRIDLALLLARLAQLDGRRDAVVEWAKFGRELLDQSSWPDYPYYRHAITFEKLLAGNDELAFTAADRAEHDRRMQTPRAAAQPSG